MYHDAARGYSVRSPKSLTCCTHPDSASGVGSARDRRRDVVYIDSEAAPVPGQSSDPPSNEFLREIRILIRDSVEQAGGRLEGLPALAAPRS